MEPVIPIICVCVCVYAYTHTHICISVCIDTHLFLILSRLSLRTEIRAVQILTKLYPFKYIGNLKISKYPFKIIFLYMYMHTYTNIFSKF